MRGQLASSTTACTTAEGRSRQLSSQVSEKIAELAQLREDAEKANSSYRMVCRKSSSVCLSARYTLGDSSKEQNRCLSRQSTVHRPDPQHLGRYNSGHHMRPSCRPRLRRTITGAAVRRKRSPAWSWRRCWQSMEPWRPSTRRPWASWRRWRLPKQLQRLRGKPPAARRTPISSMPAPTPSGAVPASLCHSTLLASCTHDHMCE